jgi:hypothetical protein
MGRTFAPPPENRCDDAEASARRERRTVTDRGRRDSHDPHAPMRAASTSAVLTLAATTVLACRAAAPAPVDGTSAAPTCPGLMVVVVNNESREALDVFSARRPSRVLLGTVQPGRAELVIGPGDTQFVAYRSGTPTLVASSASPRTSQRARFTVECRAART